MRIELSTGTEAELAMPKEPSRAVVLLPDIGGLRPLFDDLVARLSAENNWAVCAPEPFPGQTELTLEGRFEALAGFADATKAADAAAARSATGFDTAAVIGFCMGGMYTFKCASDPDFDRLVSFYGMIRLPDDWKNPQAGEPIDAVKKRSKLPNLSASTVMAHCGTIDPYTPEGEISELIETGAVVHCYEGADHGFVHDPDRETHRAEDAALAWQRTIEFLSV